MQIKCLLLGTLATYSAFCGAADNNKFYALHDVICRQYLVDRSATATTLPHVAWVSGYISAYNRQTPDTYDIANGQDSSNFLLWLDLWCQSYPDASLGAGMEKLTSKLATHRRRSK
jgi:hypothetical protein